MLVGDLTYADQYTEHGTRELRTVETSYPPRWDAWGRLMQPLAAQVSLSTLFMTYCHLTGSV